MNSVKEASDSRRERLLGGDIDKSLELLLDNYQRVTANPRSMSYLKGLLKHYAKEEHPWRACYKDNLKRFGPEKTKAVCGVLKDIIRQNPYWRHGPHGKPKIPDSGSPGVGIAEADSRAQHHSESKLDMGQLAMDEDIALVLEDLSENCDIFRVLIGLDEPPSSEVFS